MARCARVGFFDERTARTLFPMNFRQSPLLHVRGKKFRTLSTYCCSHRVPRQQRVWIFLFVGTDRASRPTNEIDVSQPDEKREVTVVMTRTATTENLGIFTTNGGLCNTTCALSSLPFGLKKGIVCSPRQPRAPLRLCVSSLWS